jgi:hypothetical protein
MRYYRLYESRVCRTLYAWKDIVFYTHTSAIINKNLEAWLNTNLPPKYLIFGKRWWFDFNSDPYEGFSSEVTLIIKHDNDVMLFELVWDAQ